MRKLLMVFVLMMSVFFAASADPQVQPPPSAVTFVALDQAIQIAIKQNPEMLTAEGMVIEAQGQLSQAASQTNPLLALHGFAVMGNTNTMLDTTASVEPMGWIMSSRNGNYGGVLSFSYPLFTAGYLDQKVAGSRFNQLSKEENLEMARLDVVLKTIIAYDAVLRAQDDLKVSEADLETSQEADRIAHQYFAVGKVPYFYVLRSQASLAKSQETNLQARNDLEIQSVQFSSVLGEPSSRIFAPSGKMNQQFSALQPLDSFLNTAYKNRPDLKGADDQVQRFTADLKSVEGSFWPQVYLFSRYDSISHTVGAFNGYNVGVHASLPLFDGGQRKGEMQETEGNMDKAKGDFMNVKLQVKNQVAQAYYDFQTALQELTAAQEEEKSAEENLRIIMLRFKAGKGIQLEVLDGEGALTSSRYKVIKAIYDANTSCALLQWAQGIGP